LPLLREQIIALYDNYRIPDKFIHVDEKGINIGLSWRNFPKDGLHRVRVVASSAKFQSNMLEFIFKDGQSLPLKNQQTVWQDAIIYSIVTDRFADGDAENNRPVKHSQLAERANFNGGDFRGIINKFGEGYFAHLGVNTLWLSPFYKTTDKAFREYPEPHRLYTGYHGYWPVEPRTVEPRMGTKEELEELISTAHSQNVKILMDFVSNHVHEEHPYFKEHRDWFGVLDLPDGQKNLRLWDEQRLTTWFEPYMPSFDFLGAPEAVEAVTDDAVWWMRNFNLDGFRHDAVKHVPNEFWRALTRKLKSEFPQKDIYQIGETFGDYELVKSYVNTGQLSSKFNFNLYWPARQAFVNDETGFAELASEMERTLDIYGQLHVMANIMDSHDQPRLAAYFDGDLDWAENTAEAGWQRDIQVNKIDTYDKIALYMGWLMAIPGIPTVYYGDEVGMTGAGDPDNRRMMPWTGHLNNRQKELRNQVAQVIQLRNSHSALRYGDYYTLLADESCFVFLRSDLNERLMIVIHRGKSPREAIIALPESLDFRRIEPILNNPQKLELKGKTLTMSLEPLTAYYFRII
jgi:cyclomaltodextrinase / maltogenic alpha-amylase / neopullulanase